MDSLEQETPDNQSKITFVKVPLIFSNAVGVGNSLTEVHLNLSVNGFVNYEVVLPFESAKTLSVQLAKVVQEYEAKIGREVFSLEDLVSKLKK